MLELEKSLERLQGRRTTMEQSSQGSAASLVRSNNRTNTSLFYFWKDLALRHKQLLEAAEVENVWLKEQVVDQAQVAKTLERFLRKQSAGVQVRVLPIVGSFVEHTDVFIGCSTLVCLSIVFVALGGAHLDAQPHSAKPT